MIQTSEGPAPTELTCSEETENIRSQNMVRIMRTVKQDGVREDWIGVMVCFCKVEEMGRPL